MRSTRAATAVVLVFSSAVAADVLPDGPHIYVEGAAELEVAPDRLELSVVVRTTHEDVKTAKAEVDRRSALLIDAARSIGVEPADISSTPLGLSPSYRYEKDARVFEGTRVERSVEVNLRNLSRYSDLMRAIIDAEISEITSTRLYAESSSEVEDRALEAALADAKARAERLAGAADAKLGDVYSISEFQTRGDVWELHSGRSTTFGVPLSAPQRALAAQSDYQEVFLPGLLKSRAQVFVVFEIKP